MKLSEHLSLSEVIKSDTAIRLGIDNEPTGEHLENLVLLAKNIFEPIRRDFGVPIYVSSGYRSKALNKAINGSKTSEHCLGMAIDIDQDGRSKVTNRMIFDYIKDNLEFNQLIWEFSNPEGTPAWVHVSYNKNGNKKQILKASKVNGKTVYSKWEQ